MAAINFPNNPSLNDRHVAGNISWRWNGSSWVSNSVFSGVMPAGTTEERPSEPKIGQIRYNTDIGVFEGYDNTGWRPFYGTVIETPVGTAPAQGTEIDQDTTFTLISSTYSNLLGLDHASSDWQVSDDPAFGTTLVNVSADTTNLTSYEVTGGVSTTGTVYWRVRYRDSGGNPSDWSPTISFTILEVIPPGPTTLGQSYGGGIYMGTIAAAGSCYYLIVSPNATGCACLVWEDSAVGPQTINTVSTVDGYVNTDTLVNNAPAGVSYIAAGFCASRTINGFSDWYLPAIDELEVFHNNGATWHNETVIGTGEAFASPEYWSSTEVTDLYAYVWYFTYGIKSNFSKEFPSKVRAVRREPV